MATFNRSVNQASTPLTAQVVRNGRQEVNVEQVIDFSNAGNVNAAADIFNAINIPAGYSLTACGVEVLKVDSAGNSGTIQLKVGATAQGSAVAPTSTGFLATVGTYTPVVPSGTSAFLNVVIATGAINAIIRVYAVLNDVRFIANGPIVIGTATTPANATSVSTVDPNTYSPALTYVL